jgi:hypothetical protein
MESVTCLKTLRLNYHKIYYLPWKKKHPEKTYFDQILYNNWAITVKVLVTLVFKPGTTTP